MSNDKKIESGAEFVTERSEAVDSGIGITKVSKNNGADPSYQESHPSGANRHYTNNGISDFSPNNKQELIHGTKFSTVAGHAYSTTKSSEEKRVHEDYSIITGSPNWFINPIGDNWIAAHQDIAAAKAAPEHTYCAIGNNTDTVYEENGTPAEGSGAVQGGSYEASQAQKDIPALLEAKAGEIAEVEREMGVGGNIKIMSAKHLYLQAGTKAITFDSGVMVPNGKSVTRKVISEDGILKTIKTSTAVYESKDTSSAVPFGDIHISASTKLNMNSGSGGVSIKSAGEVNLNSTGRLMLGGSEVAIGGSTSSGYGRVTIKTDKDVFIKSGDLMTLVAQNINMFGDEQITYITPEAVYTGNLHVQGNLIVEGYIQATKDITAGGSNGVSLLNHTHGGVETGGGRTTGPK